MEAVNIFSTHQNNKPITGWIPPKINAATVSQEFISAASPIGIVFYPISGGIIINAASYVPQMIANVGQNWVTNQAKVFEFTSWQRDLSIYTANDFISDFSSKYQIVDYIKVYDFLFENEFLIPLVSQTVKKIEDYFQGLIKNLYLKVQKDPEDDSEHSTLILLVESIGDIKRAFELLTDCQTEWFIPTLGPKISQFSVDII